MTLQKRLIIGIGILMAFLPGCEPKQASPLRPVREFRILKSLEQHTQWWYRERKWYMSSFQKKGNNPKAFARTEKLMNHTDRLIQFVGRMKSDLIRYIGKGVDPNTKMPKEPEAQPRVKRFFNYFGKEFKARFDLYEQQILELTTPEQQAKTHNLIKDKEGKPYLKTYFNKATVMEALQILTLLQIKIFENEYEVWSQSGFKHRSFTPDF